MILSTDLPEVNGTDQALPDPAPPQPDREAVNDGDWLKLHRCILDSRVFAHEGLLKVWIWCLCRANYKKRSVTVKTGTGKMLVDLQPGQFLFGRDSAAKELDMPAGTVRDRMKKLADMQNLDMKPDRHYTLVTICNWGAYQSRGDDVRQQTRQPADNNPTTSRRQPDTDKKDKKEKKERNSVPAEPAKVKKEGEPRKEKASDPLFDALAKVTGVDPNTAGSRLGKVCKTLRKAEPPYEAADVFVFVEKIPVLLPWVKGAATLGIIEEHIGKIRNAGRTNADKLLGLPPEMEELRQREPGRFAPGETRS